MIPQYLYLTFIYLLILYVHFYFIMIVYKGDCNPVRYKQFFIDKFCNSHVSISSFVIHMCIKVAVKFT